MGRFVYNDQEYPTILDRAKFDDWLNALQTYPESKHVRHFLCLQNGSDLKFCALGLLAYQIEPPHFKHDDHIARFYFEGKTRYYTDSVPESLIPYELHFKITTMNDDENCSFEEILEFLKNEITFSE